MLSRAVIASRQPLANERRIGFFASASTRFSVTDPGPYYIREVTVALSSVRDEARDSRFMDLGAPPEIQGHHPL